ncbi:atrial natriuretic peptide-converting enzyme [Eurytemora carolleeae]|uniref:atrial natriuretic peptide-converting enzyme n=1 Tax=Eurytemora carolleeae TaxID=1294199 RepID=UPI000C75C874|nr:atrial natriuretic peptide-converting enzyme [Eurytemora carolleeae]|eukprot:XP_023334145.1 atrial natriuretic peptide-converting enzyme-like [Eurytemora affinis]
MLSLSIILAVLCVPSVFSDECQFTQDCNVKCEGLQDASCACRFGSCITVGHYWFGVTRTRDCEEFTDCDCSETPETCFCREGKCISDPEDKWECHNSTDCSVLEKCSDKDCTCRGNLCEFECTTVEDCIKGDFHCSRSIGSECGCEEHLCTHVDRPKQCEEISDCVELGKCTGDAPCSCDESQCVDPWYVNQSWREDYPTKNCKNAKDCNYSIANCQNDKCTCENLEKVNKYESWGECTPI